jgi:hypothetical protein
MDPLGHEVLDRVLDPIGIPMIREARREPSNDPCGPFDGPQQHAASVRGDLPPVKPGDDFPPTQGVKIE